MSACPTLTPKNHPHPTKWIYYLNQFFNAPLDALFTLMIFVLSKETTASLFQIALFTSFKPIVSLLAFYMNTFLVGKTHRIKTYLILFNLIGCAPVLLFPFMDSTWYYIISYFLFMLAVRSTSTAWIEALKTSIGTTAMGKIVSRGLQIHQVLMMAIPILASAWMDSHPGVWKWLFSASAVMQLCSLAAIYCLPVQHGPQQAVARQSFLELALFPWKSAWDLCRNNVPFTKYLFLYLLGGIGIIAIQPALPFYFNETLNISYQKIAIAISMCKGIGFLLTSSLWAKQLTTKSIYQVNVNINILTALYFALLIAAAWNPQWLFVAYVIYGTTLSGCDLCWNMSGPIFAKKEETIMYTCVSLASIGIRGAIFPFLGQTIYQQSDAYTLFLLAGIISIANIFFGVYLNKTTPITKVLQ